MSETPNVDRVIRQKLMEVNRIKDIVTYPENVVLVTVEDVIEIYHGMMPYTLKKLDEVAHL